MEYRVMQGDCDCTEYLVVKGGWPGGAVVVLDRFDNEQGATELAAYLNGGDKVPSYMTEEMSDDEVRSEEG
jgi:hypothetical protein